MMPSDRRQPKQSVEYPFLADPRFDGLRDTYLELRSFEGTVEELAEKLGISESTAHRHVKRLKAVGVLEVEKQFQNGRQSTNRYTFPTPDWWIEGCHEGCHDTTKGQVREGCHSKSPGHEGCNGKSPGQEGCHGAGVGVTSTPQKPRSGGVSPNAISTRTNRHLEPVSVEDPDLEPEPVDHQNLLFLNLYLRPKRGHSPALGFAQCPHPDGGQGDPGSTRPNVLVVLHQVNQLVEAFEANVTRVGPVRRRKFRDTAYRMLMHDRRQLDEILDVVEYAFAHQWDLAYEMDGAADSYNSWDRGLTRLRQVRDFYDVIVAAMSQGSPDRQVVDVPSLQPVKEIPISRPKAFYDHGDDDAQSSNMADNAGERHRRYLARSARRSDASGAGELREKNHQR